MNIQSRLVKLENERSPDGLCNCRNGVVTEYRDHSEGGLGLSTIVDVESTPIFCDACGRQRHKIIIELVDAGYKPAAGETVATFNISSRND